MRSWCPGSGHNLMAVPVASVAPEGLTSYQPISGPPPGAPHWHPSSVLRPAPQPRARNLIDPGPPDPGPPAVSRRRRLRPPGRCLSRATLAGQPAGPPFFRSARHHRFRVRAAGAPTASDSDTGAGQALDRQLD